MSALQDMPLVSRQLQVDKKHRHRCGYGECYSCHQTVDLTQHKCYIQPPFEPPPRQPVRDDEEEPKTPPPQMVYADIEAMQTEDRGFTAIKTKETL